MTIYIEDIEFEAEYNYTPAEQEVRYQSNGDPGWPGVPENVEDITLTAIFKDCDLSGQTFSVDYDKLPPRVQSRIYNEICSFEAGKKADDIAAKYERED